MRHCRKLGSWGKPFRHFLAPRRNDLISYSFKTGFHSLFCFDFSVFFFLLLPWANFGHLEYISFYQEFILLRLKIIWGAVSRLGCVMKVFNLTIGDFNSTEHRWSTINCTFNILAAYLPEWKKNTLKCSKQYITVELRF